jgi:hypothetical protein
MRIIPILRHAIALHAIPNGVFQCFCGVFWDTLYRVYKKKRNLGISQEIDIVLKTKGFRRLGI